MSKMKSSKINLDSIADFVTFSDILELSELSSDDKSEDMRNIMSAIQRQEELESSDKDEDDNENNIYLAQLAANQTSYNDTTPVHQPSNQTCTYRWRKEDGPTSNNPFRRQFSDPPEYDMTSMKYFKTFFTEEVML